MKEGTVEEVIFLVGISQSSRAELSRAEQKQREKRVNFSLKGDPDGVIKRQEWKCSEPLVTMMPLLAKRITFFKSFYFLFFYYSIK